METASFSFKLPEELIAQFPAQKRGTGRLMLVNREYKNREHRLCSDLPELLEPGSLLVFNDSRVRKARIYGKTLNGEGVVEFLLLDRQSPVRWRAMVKRAKRRRAGSRYHFGPEGPDGVEGTIDGEDGEFRLVSFERPMDDTWLDQYGHVPLPPYIKRPDREEDSERYQTVYAREPGSAAAPTAGLHFTQELLDCLDERGIGRAFVTLHVGLGTFLPVRALQVEDHKMHEEYYSLPEETVQKVRNAKAEGRPVIAVGTTSLRTLESAWKNGELVEGHGCTSLFIYPGYRFKVVDGLFTNFHTPQSTLLMLVCAFAGQGLIMDSYAEAVRMEYRFFSYGDAMLIR